MTIATLQPGQVLKYDTGVVLTGGDVYFSTATVSGSRFLYNGSQFCLAENHIDTKLMEMNVWNNDGSEAFNFIMSKKYLLDVAYDVRDEVYYGIRWNYDSSYRPAAPFVGFYDAEGGSESAPILVKADFSSQETFWQTESIQPLTVETTLYHNPPFTQIVTDSRRWSDYSASYYTGRYTGWNTALWGSSSYFTITTRTAAEDLFELDSNNSRLTYYSNAGTGTYGFDVKVTGNFVAYMDAIVTTFNGSNSVLSLRVLRESSRANDPCNHLASVCFRGPSTGAHKIQSWGVRYPYDIAGSMWTLANLRISERYLDNDNTGKVVGITSGSYATFDIVADDYFTFPPGAEERAVLFSVSSAGTNLGDGVFATQPTVSHRDPPYYGETYRSFSWTGGTSGNPSWAGKVMCFDVRAGYEWDSQSLIFTNYIDSSVKNTSKTVVVYTYKEATVIGLSNLRLALKRIGTSYYVMKRDNSKAISDPGGAYSTLATWDLEYDGPVRFELYVDGTDGTGNDVAVSQFIVRDLFTSEKTGAGNDTSAEWLFPVLTVETFDLDGKPVEVPGVSSANGTVIKALDVVRCGADHGGGYTDYLNQVQLATDGSVYSGEVYVNVKQDLYKYLKRDLPIMTTESGSRASIVSRDAMYGTLCPNTLNFSGYTLGALMFVAQNAADPGDGLYVNCVETETMCPSTPPRFAWIEAVSTQPIYFYATDPNHPDLLYGFDSLTRKVYLFNMDEDQAAFCNVVSQKQIMGANTAVTSEVTAQVLNVYGNPLEYKSVSFSITSGDGSISPATDITDDHGEANTTYTVGATVGTSTISAVVTN